MPQHFHGVEMLTFKQVRMALYSLYLTNRFGFKLTKAHTNAEKKALRYEYSITLMSRMNISVSAKGLDKFDHNGQYLLLSNHRSIIDPCIIEIALKDTNILGLWVSKKELYNHFFFGKFVRNAGTILLDRESKQMGNFFKAIKESLKTGVSICVFPEGTRNKEDTPLSTFKEGSQLIAVKNKLPILPIFIKTNAFEVARTAINHREKDLVIEIEFGDIIDYRDRSMPLEDRYRQMFGIEPAPATNQK